MVDFDSIGRRLGESRKALGLSQTEMAEAVLAGGARGATRQTQSNYEKGERMPDAGYLAVAAGMGVDVLYVLTGRRESKRPTSAALSVLRLAEPPPKWGMAHPARPDATRPPTPATGGDATAGASALLPSQGAVAPALGWVWQQGEERREYRVIPKITEHVCAGLPPAEGGAGQAGAQHSRAGVLAFEARYMRAALGSDDDRFMTLQVEGDSMAPTLLDGDLVAIDVTATRINVSGIYVLRFAGQLTIKRVMRKSDGAVIISGDNRAYAAADETFTAPAAETLAVVGRMVWPRVR